MVDWSGTDWRVRLAARWLLLALMAVITWLALIPVSEIPVTTWWDKSDHAAAFILLGLVARRAFPFAPYWRKLLPALLAYGVGLELAQSFTLTRSASLLDIVADLAGLLIYGAAAHWLGSRRMAKGRRARHTA